MKTYQKLISMAFVLGLATFSAQAKQPVSVANSVTPTTKAVGNKRKAMLPVAISEYANLSPIVIEAKAIPKKAAVKTTFSAQAKQAVSVANSETPTTKAVANKRKIMLPATISEYANLSPIVIEATSLAKATPKKDAVKTVKTIAPAPKSIAVLPVVKPLVKPVVKKATPQAKPTLAKPILKTTALVPAVKKVTLVKKKISM
jgi:hypothetical protein